MIRDAAIVAHEPNLLASVRELYSRLPEARNLEPCKLQGTLWLLHYTTELAPEAEIAAAVEVARDDYDPERERRREQGEAPPCCRRPHTPRRGRDPGLRRREEPEEIAREGRGFVIEWDREE